MDTLVKELIAYFNISPTEAEKFVNLISIFEPNLSEVSSKFLKDKPNDYSELDTLNAFKKLLGLICLNSNSTELKSFYDNFLKKENVEISIKEIVIDTIYDEARFRIKSSKSNEEDRNLFKEFEQYHKLHETLYDLLDGIIDSMLSLYEMPSGKFEEKRMHLIKEVIPVLTQHGKEIKKIWPLGEYDIWLVNFMYSIQRDLEHLHHNNESRFRKFFTPNEYERISKMEPDQQQVYLANAAANNVNMRAAKNLIKIKQEIENYQKILIKLEKELEINYQIIDSAKQHANQYRVIEPEHNIS